MKTSRIMMLMSLIAISVLCLPILSHAYTTIHGDFGPGSANKGSIGVQYPGYMVGGASVTNFRAFVPPGTTRISLQITVQNYSNLYTAARMGTYPSGYSGPPAYDPGTGSSLMQLESGNCFATTIGGGINVVNDAWSSPLSVSRSGWLYVDIVGGNNVYWIKYQVYFDVSAYDAWYSTINWATNVEGSGTYTPPTNSGTGTTTTTTTTTGTSGTSTGTTSTTTTSGSGQIFGTSTGTGTSSTTSSSSGDPLTCMFSGGVWQNGQCAIVNTSATSTTSTTSTASTSGSGQIFGNSTGTGTSSTTTTTTTATSSISDPLTCMFSGGVWQNGQCAAANTSATTSTTGTTASQTTGSALQITVNASFPKQFAQREITAAEVGNRSSVVLKPTLQLYNLPSGNYELYAGIMKSGGLYLSDKDIGNQTVFIKWMGGENLRAIDKRVLAGDVNVEFDIFEALKLSNSSPQYYASQGFHFLVAVAPEGSSDVQTFLKNFWGAEIWFSSTIK